MSSFILLLVFIIFVLYFTELSIDLQTAILAIFVVEFIVLGLKKRNKQILDISFTADFMMVRGVYSPKTIFLDRNGCLF